MPQIAIGGSFCIAHSNLLATALRSHGLQTVSGCKDPFGQLLERVKNPDAIIITTQTDTMVHAEVQRLVSDLAAILLPDKIETRLLLHIDTHELFYHLIHNGYMGTFDDMLQLNMSPAYATTCSNTIHVPPFTHATPIMLERLIESVLAELRAV